MPKTSIKKFFDLRVSMKLCNFKIYYQISETVTKKDLIKPEEQQQQSTSTNFMEKKIPDKNKEIKIISDVNLEDPIKLDLLSSNSQSTNLIKGFSETNTILPETEIKSEDIVDPLKSSNLYRMLPESSKPQNMIYKTTDKNNKETVYKIYLTSISKKSANNNDSPTKSPPDKSDLTVKKNQPELQKKIIENFNKVFANTPVKFNETVDKEKNTKTSTPNCVIYKSQGGTLTPIKMVCKTPRVSSVKIISNNSPEIKSHGSFSKIDISKLKAKLNENLRKMSGTTPERRILDKSPSSLVKVEHNKSPKTSIENVPSDAMNRLNEYLKKIQEEKKLNKTQKKTIEPKNQISGISIIQKTEPSAAEASKSPKSTKYPYPIKLKEKSNSKTKNKLKMRGTEISKDGEQFFGYQQKTITESNHRTCEQLKIMKSLLKENQKQLMETEWKIKIDKELNVAPRIEVNKDSKTYSRVPKKILSPSKIENEDSVFDINDMPFESIDCNLIEYCNDNLIDQKDISIVIQSNNIVVNDTKLVTNEESHQNQLELIDSEIIKSKERDSVSEQACVEEFTVKSMMKEKDKSSICDEEIVVNKINEILESEEVTEELSQPKTSKKSFKQMDIRNCFQKSFKKKIPPPHLSIQSPNLKVKEQMIEDSNQKINSIKEDEATISKFVANIFSRCEALEAQTDPNEPSSPLDEIITKFVFDIFTKIESLEIPDNNLKIKKLEETKSPVRRSRRITEGKLSVEDISAVEQSLVDLGMLDETNNSFNASEDIIVEESFTKPPIDDKNSEKISFEEINDKKINENVDKEEVFPIKDNEDLKIDESTVKFVFKDEIKKGSTNFQNLHILKRLPPRKANVSKEAISRAGKSFKSVEMNIKEDKKVDIIEEVLDETKIYKKDSGIGDEEIVENLKVSENENETKLDVVCQKISSRSRSRSLRNKSIVEEPNESLSDKTPKRITRKSENNEFQSNAPPKTISTDPISESNEELQPKTYKKTSRKPINPVISTRSLRKSGAHSQTVIENTETTVAKPIQTKISVNLSNEENTVPQNIPVVKEEILSEISDNKSEGLDKIVVGPKPSKRIARKPITPEKSLRTLRKSKIFVPVEDFSEVPRQNPDITKKSVPDSEEQVPEISLTVMTVPEQKEQKSEVITETLQPNEVSVNCLEEEVIKKQSKRVSSKPKIPSKSSRSLRQSMNSIPKEEISVNIVEKTPLAMEPEKLEEEKAKPMKRSARKPIITEKSSRSLRKSSSGTSEINMDVNKHIVKENFPVPPLQELEASVDSESHCEKLKESEISASAVMQEISPLQEEDLTVSEIQEKISTPDEISPSYEVKKKSSKRVSRTPIIPETTTRSLTKTVVPVSKEIILETEETMPNEIVLQVTKTSSPMSESLKEENAGSSKEVTKDSVSDLDVNISEIHPVSSSFAVITESQSQLTTLKDPSSAQIVTKSNQIKSSKRNTRKAIIPEKTLRSLRKSGKDITKESNNDIPEPEKKTEISEDSSIEEKLVPLSLNEEKQQKVSENVSEQIPVRDETELSTTNKSAKKVGQKKQIQKEIKDETEDIPLAQLTPTTSKRNSRKSKIIYKDNSDESETEVSTPKTGKRKPTKEDYVIDQPKRTRRATRLSTASSISDRRDDPGNDDEFNGVEGDEKNIIKTHGKRGRSLSSVKEENVEKIPKRKRAYNKKETTKAVLEGECSNESRKRERTSGNSDDFNESKKQKTSHIVCGKCMETIPRVSWKRHLLGHNGIGWIVGEEPDWVSVSII